MRRFSRLQRMAIGEWVLDPGDARQQQDAAVWLLETFARTVLEA